MAKRSLPILTSPAAVAAYAWVHDPDDKFNKDKPDYKLTLVLPDDEDTQAFVAEIEARGRQAAAADRDPAVVKLAKRKRLKLPIELGSDFNDKLQEKAEENDEDNPEEARKEEFEGMILVKTKAKFAPKVFLPRDLVEAAGDREVKVMSGDVVKVKVQPNPYEGFGGGISLRLKSVKLVEKNNNFEGDDDFGDDDDDDYVTASSVSQSSGRDETDNDQSVDDDDIPF